MDNSLSKAIKVSITDETNELTDQFVAEITASVSQQIEKQMHNFIRNDNEDFFIHEAKIVQRMLPLMERAEKYCLDNPEFTRIDSDCGKYYIQHSNEHFIKFSKYVNINERKLSFTVSEIDFQNINYGNNINCERFTYSPINRGMKVNGISSYQLNDELKHDEAWYFQKLTQENLPDEEYYKFTEEVLVSLWNGNYVSLIVDMQYIFSDTKIEEYAKLVQKMEEHNAEHN